MSKNKRIIFIRDHGQKIIKQDQNEFDIENLKLNSIKKLLIKYLLFLMSIFNID